MNKNEFSNKWSELKNKVREKWSKLTNDDINQINGNYDKLSNKLQQHYGFNREHAEREINNWCQACESKMKGRGEEESSSEEEGRSEESGEEESGYHRPKGEMEGYHRPK